MSDKEKYQQFVESGEAYIPIYSQPWWMDAVCGEDNWDVWICQKNGRIIAAMPYYIENRTGYRYITKAPLTQNNGIIFNYPPREKLCGRAAFEEEIIDCACKYISQLGVDVYEQQYQPEFTNWLPFYWNEYKAYVRYTYRFSKDRLIALEKVWEEMDKKKRSKVKKGLKLCCIYDDLPPERFYKLVELTFKKQNLSCPFSINLWMKLYSVTLMRGCGKISYAMNKDGQVVSAVFWVWDDKSMYQLISGGSAELQHYEGKSALVWKGINDAASMGLAYDFEGSVIKRISKSNRLFGADPIPYFRIRKVFNKTIAIAELEREYE